MSAGQDIVVSAAIVDKIAQRVLLAQRSPSVATYPWLWCSPGGKVESGESHMTALSRELSEEIRVELNGCDFDLLYRHEVNSLRTGQIVPVFCYIVPSDRIIGKPTLTDVTIGIDWCDAKEVTAKRLTPADNAEIDKIVKLLNSFAGYSP